MEPCYGDLFENYVESDDREVFAHGPVDERDFIEAEFGHDRSRPDADRLRSRGRSENRVGGRLKVARITNRLRKTTEQSSTSC